MAPTGPRSATDQRVPMQAEAVQNIIRDRAQFFAYGNEPPHTGALREPIKASWRRSVLNGLDPARCRPKFDGPARPNDQFKAIACRILDEEAIEIPNARMSLSLTDHEGRIVRRWVPDSRFEHYLDKRLLVPDHSLAETWTGTGGSGIALETGGSAIVFGPEHFSEDWFDITSTAAPVRHPVTRRIVGTVGIVCANSDSSPVLLAWVSSVAKQIERELSREMSSRQHQLLNAYLKTNHDARHPVICLDETTVISNAVAARMLDAADQAMLWEHVSRTLATPDQRDQGTTLSNGTVTAASSDLLFDGDNAVGAVVTLRQAYEGNSRPRQTGSDVLPGLVGSGPAWRNAWSNFERPGLDSRVALLLVGATGVGKTTSANAVLSGSTTVSIDLSVTRPSDREAWDRQAELLHSTSASALLLEHVELIRGSQAGAAVDFLSRMRESGIDVVGTMTTTGSVTSGRVGEMFDTVVRLPALRDRIEDLPNLLGSMTARYCRGHEPVWSASAVQTLSRADWPYNLHSLDSVVRKVLGGLRGRTQIGITDLPEELRAQASRRNLSGLEAAEASAIATALKQTNGNKRLAADALGIARSTLYRKLSALGIDLAASTF